MNPLYHIAFSAAQKVAPFLEPETAHNAAIKLLRAMPIGGTHDATSSSLSQDLLGMTFPNPLGLAAGFDKNAEVPDTVLGLGFGFTEIGTVTPLPQIGNPKPRLFRLPEDKALINRFGFNSQGHEAAKARLTLRKKSGKTGIVGVNIGANKESPDRIADYVLGIETFYALADYFTVNISSPNTPGLRDLQGAKELDHLLGAVVQKRAKMIEIHKGDLVPILLKVAPDLDVIGLDAICKAVTKHKLDGLIISNTTLSRAGLEAASKDETGGMSGAPLFARATAALGAFRQRLGPDIVLVGAGGVSNADDVTAKIAAGADLVQLYSALVYQGFGLPSTIIKALPVALKKQGVNTVSDLRDRDTVKWAARFETEFAP